MSGDYKAAYGNTSPSRKKAVLANKDQASLYKYHTPLLSSTTNLYNNQNQNQNNNYSNQNQNQNHNSNYLQDSSKYYNNQSNIKSNINNTNTNTNTLNNSSNKFSAASTYSVNNSSIDYDVDDDQDFNYSNISHNTNKNIKNTLNDSNIDYSTDENPSKLIKPLQHQQQHQQQHYPIINNQQQQQQTRTTTQHTTTSSSSSNSKQQNKNIVRKLIIDPWNNFYYGSSGGNSGNGNNSGKIVYLWPFDRTENLNTKQIIWVFIFSCLFISGILGLFATKYNGIQVNIPYPTFTPSEYIHTTTTTTTNPADTANLIKEQFSLLMDEYMKKNEILSSHNKLLSIINNIENEVKQLSKKSDRDQYSEVIKEIKQQIVSLQLDNDGKVNEAKVGTMVREMFNKYDGNETNKKELQQQLQESISNLKKVYNEVSENLSKVSSDKQIELESKYSNQIKELTKHSSELLSTHSAQLNELTQKLEGIELKSINELNKEYKSLVSKLELFSNHLTQSIESTSIKFIDSSKQDFINTLEQRLSTESNRITVQYNQVNNQFSKIQQFLETNPSIEQITNTISSLDGIKDLVGDLLEIYSADKIAKADYALGLAGASIEYNSKYYQISDTYPPVIGQYTTGNNNGIMNILSSYYNLATYWIMPNQLRPNPPETILDPLVNTGSCWGFYGGNGTVVIKLAKTIEITGFSMEHIHSNISHHIDSAPKHFQVFGLKNSSDIGTPLGEFTYNTTINRHLQSFSITDKQQEQDGEIEEYSHVALRILSNHGFKYTCLYRFRVHGNEIPHPEREQLVSTTSTTTTPASEQILELEQKLEEQEQTQQAQAQQQDTL